MDITLKPIEEQVIVITGASSGIGLATAREAARRGARVVMVARDEPALRRSVEEIRARGGEATWVVADVANAEEVYAAAEAAREAYGGFDSWVNNAGVAIYGRLEDVVLEDARRLFDVNYWGMVHGSLAALPQLRHGGGALINVGSLTSDRSLPLQGHYGASKHAVKALTDTLRDELEHEGAPVSVTLVKPGSIDTPFPRHARNLMEGEPELPAPVYRPETVARAVLFCAEHPRRSITVGGGGRANALLGMLSPPLGDRIAQRMFEAQRRDEEPAGPRRDTLYRPPLENGYVRGDHRGYVHRTSAYTHAALRPVRTLLALGALGAMAAVAASAVRRRREEEVEVEVRLEPRAAADAAREPEPQPVG